MRPLFYVKVRRIGPKYAPGQNALDINQKVNPALQDQLGHDWIHGKRK
jgi:hypothetical protein